MSRRISISSVIVGMLFTLVGSSSERTVARGGASVITSGLFALPGETTVDIRTFADHLVLATITDVEESSPRREVVERGEGYAPIPGMFSIDSVLWSRPGVQPAPGKFGMAIEASLHDGELRFHRDGGAPQLMEGRRYLVALVWYSGRWTQLHSLATFLLDANQNIVAPVDAAGLQLESDNQIAQALVDAIALTRPLVDDTLFRDDPDARRDYFLRHEASG